MSNICLLITFFFVGLTHAQKASKDDLQGMWKLSCVTDSTGAEFDLINSKYSPGAHLSEEDLEGVRLYWEDELNYYKNTSLKFEGNFLFYNKGQISFNSKFKLKKLKDNIYLVFRNSDDGQLSYQIFIIDNKLHLIIPFEKISYEYIFIKMI